MIWFEEGPFIELMLVTEQTGPPAFIAWVMQIFSPNGMIKRFDN